MGKGLYYMKWRKEMDIYELLNEIITNDKYDLSIVRFADEKKELLKSECDKQIFDLLKNIASLGTKISEKGIEFFPHIVFDGKRSFAAEDISEDDYMLLLELDLSKIPLNLRAKTADLLWTQRGEYSTAIIAAEAYYDLFNETFTDDDWIKSLDMIERSIYISLQIGNSDLYNKACQTIYDHIIRLNGKDPQFLSIRLMEIIINRGFGDLDIILKIIDTIIVDTKNEAHKIETAYELKVKCLNKKKDRTAARAVNVEFAHFYVNLAEDIVGTSQGLINAEHYLKKAIMLFRNNGETIQAENTHRRLVEIQKKIPETMHTSTTEVNVTEIFDNIRLNMQDLSFQECIIRLTQLVTFKSKEEVKNDLFRDLSEHPFIHMFPQNIINEDGQTLLTLLPLESNDLEGNSKLLDLHIFHKLLEHQNIVGNFFLKFALFHIREINDFEASDLDFLIYNNPIIPEGREQIFKSAIYMFLKGDYYEAVHILAPQIENLFRNIAKEVGGLTVTLESDGTSKEKVLSSIFDLPELLDCYDNDIIFNFKGLLNEQAGANIRNNIAHGIMTESSASGGACLCFGVLVIRLLTYTSTECIRIIRDNKKLHQYIDLEDEDVISFIS